MKNPYGDASSRNGINLPTKHTLLFVDDKDVLYRSGTKKVVQPLTKYKNNPVIVPDKIWESAIGWSSQYRDPDSGKFQMWYQAYSEKHREDKRLRSVVCYAESDDGIHWIKPKLGLFEYYEEKDTNIVLIGAGGHGDRYCNSVLVDENEGEPNRRYKMLYHDWTGGEKMDEGGGAFVAFSPDGIHWEKYEGGMVHKTNSGGKGQQPPFEGDPVCARETLENGTVRKSWRVPMAMSDAMDVFFDISRNAFVAYGKMWVQGPDGGHAWKHGMGRIESKDFLKWSKPELILTPGDDDPPHLEFHTSPVFPYEGMYFSLNQIMDRAAGTIDVEFMSSRDGFSWDRTFARIPVLERGEGEVFDAGSIFTNNTVIPVKDEIWFYYAAYRGPATGGVGLGLQEMHTTDYRSGIGLAKIKRDRFVGIQPDPNAMVKIPGYIPPEKRSKDAASNNRIGQVTLKPLNLSEVESIYLNTNAKNGAVRVELLDVDGYRIKGFTRDDAVPITEDGIELQVTWQERQLADLPPGEYLIRIHLENATLFSCSLNPFSNPLNNTDPYKL